MRVNPEVCAVMRSDGQDFVAHEAYGAVKSRPRETGLGLDFRYDKPVFRA